MVSQSLGRLGSRVLTSIGIGPIAWGTLAILLLTLLEASRASIFLNYSGHNSHTDLLDAEDLWATWTVFALIRTWVPRI